MIKITYKKVSLVLSLIFFLITLMPGVLAKTCEQNINSEQLKERPEIKDGFYAKTQAQIVINRSPEEIKLWFDNVPPETIIHSTSKVSGISSTKELSKQKWGQPESVRLICYQDENSSLEQLIENIPGKIFRLQMWDFTKDITHSIKYAISEFTITANGENQSTLAWNFAFKPNHFIFRLPLKIYLKDSFQEYMQQGLTNIKTLLES